MDDDREMSFIFNFTTPDNFRLVLIINSSINLSLTSAFDRRRYICDFDNGLAGDIVIRRTGFIIPDKSFFKYPLEKPHFKKSRMVVNLRAAELREKLVISCWLLVVSLGLVKRAKGVGEIEIENCFKSVA